MATLLTTKQLADKYGLTVQAIRSRIKRNQLTPVERTPMLMFAPDALDSRPAHRKPGPKPWRKANRAAAKPAQVTTCPIHACAICVYRARQHCMEWDEPISVEYGTCSRWVRDYNRCYEGRWTA